MSASSEPKRYGFLIVDLQNDFLHPLGAYARGKTTSSQAGLLPERVLPVAQALKAQPIEGLGAGHFVDEMQVDEQEIGLTLTLVHDVGVPHFL